MFKSLLRSNLVSSEEAGMHVIAAVKCLSLLAYATKTLPTELFYAQMESLDFKTEYKSWNRQDFCYFNFPFLFDATAKARIIHIDAMHQMSKQYEDAHACQALMQKAKQLLDHSKAHDLQKGMKAQANPYLILQLRREALVSDLFAQLPGLKSDFKKPLKVQFVGSGEEGMDQGGVQKEFFKVAVQQLLDPIYGMFESDSETRFSWFCSSCLEKEEPFELFGNLTGLALYNGVMLGINFPPIMYKKLLDEKINLQDFALSFPVLATYLVSREGVPSSAGL